MRFKLDLRVLAGVLFGAAALSVIPAQAASGVQLNIKPGLWETTTQSNFQGSLVPQSYLDKMTPEQRQRIQAAMAEAQKPHTAQACVSRDELMRDFAKSGSKDCNWTTVQNTANTLEYHGVCSNSDSGATETSTTTVHLDAVNPEMVKGTMQFSVSRNGSPVTSGSGNFSSRFLGSSCNAVK